MARTMKIPQQRAIETRQRIVDAAYQVFARRGYGQATVDEIGDEAGVSMGALYHHFSSKQDLFKAILDEHMQAEEIELSSLADASSFREMIERFVRFWLDHLKESHEHDPLFMEIFAHATREGWAQQAVQSFIERGERLLRETLHIAQTTGLVRPELDVDAAATLVYASMEGLAVLWAINADRMDLERLREPYAELLTGFFLATGDGDVNEFRQRMTALFADRESVPAPTATA